jgi:glycosyltransferase involved in cell wall biosynthesis
MVRPIKIGLLMNASESWMGGVIYIQNLVKAIASLPPEQRSAVKLYLLTSPETSVQFYHDLLPLLDGHYQSDFLSTKFSNKIRRRIAKQIPSLRKSIISDLQISSIGRNIDFFYPVVGLREIFWDFPSKWSAWIPDLQHKYLPHFFPYDELEYRDNLFLRMANCAPNIVFSSNVALDDFRKFYPTSTAQTHVLNFHTTIENNWLDADPEVVKNRYHIPNKFFLVSNQFWQHKNHKIIIETLHILQQSSLYPVVVCTGEILDNRCPTYGLEVIDLVEHYQLHQQFLCLGLIPRSDQIQLMRQSLAVIQPSLFEGWSTVVEDAKALGKTILLSDLAVHLEQNPPNSTYFSPHSAEDLAQKITVFLHTLKPSSGHFTKTQISHEQQSSQLYANQFLKLAHIINNDM